MTEKFQNSCPPSICSTIQGIFHQRDHNYVLHNQPKTSIFKVNVDLMNKENRKHKLSYSAFPQDEFLKELLSPY